MTPSHPAKVHQNPLLTQFLQSKWVKIGSIAQCPDSSKAVTKSLGHQIRLSIAGSPFAIKEASTVYYQIFEKKSKV